MDLNTINTPSDLIQQNSTPTDPVQDIVDNQVMELTPKQVMELTQKLVGMLGGWHQSVAEDFMKDGDIEKCVTWMKDEQKLHTCWDILDNIEM